MAEPIGDVPIEIVERIPLMPHPSDPSHPPIEPYISDVLPELLAKYEDLGLVMAVFDSDPGLGEHPKEPEIHVYYDEDTGVTGLPITATPIRSHGDAEAWLEGYWQQPRQDFNISTMVPQLVITIDGKPYLVVTIQLEKPQLMRMKHNDHWSKDLSRMAESSGEFELVKIVATDYMDTT